MSDNLPSGTITILFTDIEGSTKLLQRLGDEYACVLADQRQILRIVFEKYDGFEIDTQGDSFFFAFKQAIQAIKAVAEAQQSLALHAWPKGEKLRVRMALHTGEPKIGSTGYVGLDIHRAARICSTAYGGQILLSETTYALVEQTLPKGLSLLSLGEHRLKDLQRPEKIYQLVISGLPSEFPTLKSLNHLPNNLPLQLTSFVGREHEIDEIKGLLKKERLLTLSGAGGSGKTRLALQVAADMLDTFQDGVWLVDLAPLSNPTFIIQAVAAVLNLHEEAGRGIHDVLFDHLRSHKALLILDNCEHLVDSSAKLAESLLQNCPQLHILVTSREALGIPCEKLFIVPTLSIPKIDLFPGTQVESLAIIQKSEAVQLFVERAVNLNLSFSLTKDNALLTVKICQRLDGIPLAIELAAARTRIMTLEQILARLDDRFKLLTEGSRTALPRQQTLRAMVEWSYDLLPESEQRLFRYISVFSGGWTLEAAETICSDDETQSIDILDLITHLADKSLIIANPEERTVRFKMLETVRQYARERLQDNSEEKSLCQRHFNYYFNFVKESQQGLTGPNPSIWLKRLDQEKDNIFTALSWAIQEIDQYIDAAQEMTGGLWMWWLARGILSEGRHWLKLALGRSQEHTSARAKALTSAGFLALQQGDFPEASRCMDESISIIRNLETPDLPGLAHTTHMFGHTALDLGDVNTASKAFNESLKLYKELKDQYYIGTLISDLGMVVYHQGDYESARRYQEQSLEIFQESGNTEVISQTIHRIGELARLEGDYEQAEKCYQSCLITYREMGMKLEIASNLHKLGYVAQHYGDYQKAWSLFTESLSTQREVGNKQGIAECLAGLAGLAAATRQPVRALRLFGAAKALLDDCKAPLAPADQAEWKRDQALACGQLDEDACIQAQIEGQAMVVEHAIEYALRKD